MLFSDGEGKQVEIPSLEQDSDMYLKVSNKEDFELLVKAMGWVDSVQFKIDTGVTAEELIGHWWFTIHNRIYLKD